MPDAAALPAWRLALGAALALAVGPACAPRLAAIPPAGTLVVAELYESPRMPQENIDSLAYWEGGDCIVATAKSTHRLLLFDAADGRLLRTFGTEGAGPGQFRRPNGVAVVGDLLLVTERDNCRVQVLRLPNLTPLLTFGEGTLRFPYGITAFKGPQGIEVFVTDAYLGPQKTVPPAAELGERVRHFRLARFGDAWKACLVKSFGDTSGAGILHVVESIAADPDRRLLLIADEWEHARDIKVYDLDGRFTGRLVGSGDFRDDPEGLALVACGDGGFWIATDQRAERTVFVLYDRNSFAALGSFTGRVVANTDGIAVARSRTGDGSGGGLVAVNNDASVAAFPLRAVAELLPVPATCFGSPSPGSAAAARKPESPQTRSMQ